MNLTDLLIQLAAAAPQICELTGMPTVFGIRIFDDKNYIIHRRLVGSDLPDPLLLTALEDLAWLDMAIRWEIERRGWGYRVEMWDLSGKYAALVWHLSYTNGLTFGDSAVECLLAAFLAAVEGEGRGDE